MTACLAFWRLWPQWPLQRASGMLYYSVCSIVSGGSAALDGYEQTVAMIGVLSVS